MVEQLHRLIDTGAAQPVINERVAALLENSRREIEKIGSDHEKRIRYLERTVSWALGAIGALSSLVLILKEFMK
jgi:hypothetical protein